MAYTYIHLFICFVNAAVLFADNKSRKNIDFIVVGAGASGAAVANRLSENGEYNVLLLEAGEEPLQLTKIPYFSIGPFKGKMDWNFQTEKQENAFLNYEEQKTFWPRGKALGGTTAINALFYSRGNRKDFDYWKSLGNDGWGFDDLLPFFKKLEDYRAPLIREIDKEFHGQRGPIIVNRPAYSSDIAKAFLEASKLMGYSVNDFNARTQTGFMNPVFTMVNGSRLNTYDAYLKPFLNRKNLYISTNVFVTKVIFKNKTAIGVQYETKGKSETVYCKKEVILCGGAINSPQLLLLSGIGPRKTLEAMKIPVLVNLQAVGENLQDHVTAAGVTYTFPDHIGINHHYAINSETFELWETKGEGPLTVSGRIEGTAFVNTKYAPIDGDYPDIQIIFHQPPVPSVGLQLNAAKSVATSEGNSSVLYVRPIVLRPKSKGYLTLRSADPHDHPLIQPNYLSEESDVNILLEGIKISIQLMETEPFNKLGGKRLMKKALGCETQEQFSDDYFKCFIRRYTSPFFHAVGTCKMGTKDDKLAVVDNRLRVYGVKGLRVVDGSIMPTLVSAPTMVPCIMIGEKGAAMILEDWKKKHDEL